MDIPHVHLIVSGKRVVQYSTITFSLAFGNCLTFKSFISLGRGSENLGFYFLRYRGGGGISNQMLIILEFKIFPY